MPRRPSVPQRRRVFADVVRPRRRGGTWRAASVRVMGGSRAMSMVMVHLAFWDESSRSERYRTILTRACQLIDGRRSPLGREPCAAYRLHSRSSLPGVAGGRSVRPIVSALEGIADDEVHFAEFDNLPV